MVQDVMLVYPIYDQRIHYDVFKWVDPSQVYLTQSLQSRHWTFLLPTSALLEARPGQGFPPTGLEVEMKRLSGLH